MWVPFYSVHFNDPKVGLRAYHLLREFSVQRQLSPPKEMITVTEKFLEQKRPRGPKEAEKFNEKFKNSLGLVMDKKQRARVLMDQKATSVADIAAVLAIQEEEIKNGFADGKRGYLTKKARKRRREGLRREQELAERAKERVANFEESLSDQRVQYSIEDHQGNKEYHPEGNEVKIFWADLHDARYAASWPERVGHGELEQTRGHVMPGQKRVPISLLANNDSSVNVEERA
jgi:Transcriptional regulation of mitochondrial recombination